MNVLNSTPRILIVDDHPNTAAMLARALGQFNKPVEVLTARSGQEALDIIGQKNGVDVLISDFMMPGMNGLELIEKLQGNREPSHIILVTAYDSPGLAATAKRLKVSQYLVKPVQPDKMREIVGKVLENLNQPKSNPTAEVPAPSNFKILIADDQPDNVHLLATRLQSEGYSFITAGDGQETLDKLRAELPDMVLLDVNMPKKSGFEVLAEMRDDPELLHIPVIVLTAARTSVRDIREGLGLGADDYITKPFDWRELAARVRSKLRIKHAEDILRRRNKELSLLPEIGQDLSARVDVEELAAVILKRAVETLAAASGNLVILNVEDQLFHKTYEPRDVTGWSWEDALDWLVNKGLINEVTNAGQGAIISDMEGDARWPPVEGLPLRSALCVPLLSRRGVIGALTLAHEQPSHFNPDHISLLQAIASQAAIAIENAQLYAIERKRVNEMVALNQLTREISNFTHSADLFERLPKLIRETLNYPAVTLWLMQDEELNLRSQSGTDNAPRPSILSLAPQQVAATRQPAHLSGSVEERVGERAGSGPLPMHSAMAVPLLAENKVSGVLAIHSKEPGVFQESDRVMLETLASQVASALERIRLFESVEQERTRLAAVLRAAADAILVMDPQGRLQLINPAGKRLFTDIQTKLGHPLPQGQGYDDLLKQLEQARDNKDALTVQEIKWPDKRVFNVMVTTIEHGGQVAMLHDVTSFKELERVKNEFLATASHDLKNPLTAIIGYADLLTKFGQLAPQQANFVERIRHSSRQMFELVQDLLELARLDMGIELKMEPVDLREMVSVIAEDFRGQAGVKQQTLTITSSETSLLVNVDVARMKQVLRNLIGNAVKYTPQGGQVVVATELHDQTARFWVRDTGIGIPAGDLPFIFDKFYRVQSDATRDIEGSGLGLAIVKAIIDQHDGQVAVESREGQGACFTVNLPIAQLFIAS
jgi:signal transduction histidine kinase/DNA-binding response OmpR family regulator